MTASSASKTTPTNHYPAWSPRFWHGMRVGVWLKLLARNGFQIDLRRLPTALGVSFFTPANDILAGLQYVLHERKIRQTEISQPPIFILGHWRSGTTLLHELLVCDDRFVFPNTFQCFAPSHFLMSEALMVRLGSFLLPKRRPMDNMEAGWLLPQEDEFALTNLGLPSTYLRIAFPRTQTELLNYLNMDDLSSQDLRKWQEGFLWFIKALTYHYGGKRLVLKSPPHTGRLGVLAKMFPDAKFIHLTRDPCKLYSSTQRLWNSLSAVQGLQHPAGEDDNKQYVVDCLNAMYQNFERDRELVQPENFFTLSYEDLAARPFEAVQEIYEDLQLGEFAMVEPALRERLKNHRDYQPNQHQMDDQVMAEVAAAWPEYAERYGYVDSTTS